MFWPGSMGNDMELIYGTEATATGGRTGTATTSDGRLAVTLDTVKELGGVGGEGTNPEQLFAAGYAACFLGALKYVAGQNNIKVYDGTTVTAAVGIGPRVDGRGFQLDVALSVSMPGIERALADEIIAAADIVCPYSDLARNGIAVRLTRRS
jgi:osmotically inducible protein OsmC